MTIKLAIAIAAILVAWFLVKNLPTLIERENHGKSKKD